MSRPATGIRREVTFTPWCGACFNGWTGNPQQLKSDAAYFLACHNVDVHGGTPRLGEELDEAAAS